jgi:hypothetical protein
MGAEILIGFFNVCASTRHAAGASVKHKKMKQKGRKIVLDDLLDRTEPFATFHGAYLHKINKDYNKHE